MPEKLVIASNNTHKIAEIKAILQPYFSLICSLGEVGLDVDVVEDGETFEANARKKAGEIVALLDGCAVLADDSGIVVDALDGAPGVYSARYAGQGHDDAANNNKLLRALHDVPDERRGCRFVSCVALERPGREAICAMGICGGRVGYEPRGVNGFGYDPLFVFTELGKTFAQLSAEEKNRYSHRARALAALREKLASETSAI